MKKLILFCLFSALLFGCTPSDTETFPDFITENDDYFVTRIDGIPDINEETYRLSVTGCVETPAEYSLADLRALDQAELPITIECIGNRQGGPLVGTARWKGFLLLDLLEEAGLDQEATGVKFIAADGYYASYTLEQVRENGALGALYMNGESLPPAQGFPLRVINPGFYGAKQAAWVTDIEVIDRPLEDYWEDRGWDLTPPMDVDTKFFFPDNNATIDSGRGLAVGGAAFGGRRIAKVEISTDDGESWYEANIVRSIDTDNVWVFWEANIIFDDPGRYTIYSRATDVNGITQPRTDDDWRNGTNSWPSVRVTVTGK